MFLFYRSWGVLQRSVCPRNHLYCNFWHPLWISLKSIFWCPPWQTGANATSRSAALHAREPRPVTLVAPPPLSPSTPVLSPSPPSLLQPPHRLLHRTSSEKCEYILLPRLVACSRVELAAAARWCANPAAAIDAPRWNTRCVKPRSIDNNIVDRSTIYIMGMIRAWSDNWTLS